jgi:hypothetical protein
MSRLVQNPLTTLPDAVAGRARAGTAGWPDRAGRPFLLRHDRDRGWRASECFGSCLCRGAGAGRGRGLHGAWPRPFRRPRRPPGSSSTAMKDVSARRRSCAISPAICRKRKRKVSMRSNEPFQKALLTGKTDARGLAVEAELLCRFDGRPHDQSGSRALHGQAHGRQDHRVKASHLSLISHPDEITQPHPGSRRTTRVVGRMRTIAARIPGVKLQHPAAHPRESGDPDVVERALSHWIPAFACPVSKLMNTNISFEARLSS